MATDSPVVDKAVAQEAFASEANPVNTTNTVASPASSTQFAEVNSKGYTEEDLKRVREQEKSKLYPQIDSLKEEVNILKKEREERIAAAEAAQAAAEAEAKAKAEAELDVRQLLEVKEKEWASQLDAIRQENARKDALLERERQYAELTNYRNRRLEEERDNIIPELVDLISGNNPDEIEQSITNLRDRSAKILDSAQQALQSTRREMVGTKPTLPPTMENNSDQQQFTAEQLSAMSVTEYAKIRNKLLPGVSSPDKGIFG